MTAWIEYHQRSRMILSSFTKKLLGSRKLLSLRRYIIFGAQHLEQDFREENTNFSIIILQATPAGNNIWR